MAINLLEQPSSGVPTIGNSDYQKQNINDLAGLVANGSIFTDWTSTAAVPDAQTGAVIKHINNIYEVQLTDETITGSTSEGANYVKATVSGSVMTLSFVTSVSGFAYYSQYDGIYNASNEQLLSDVLYKTGTTYYRSRGNGRDFNSLVLNNGAVIYSGGLQTLNSNIETGTGTINGATIASTGINGASISGTGINGATISVGAISSNGGNITTVGGYIDTNGGHSRAVRARVIQGSWATGVASGTIYSAINAQIPAKDFLTDTFLVNGEYGTYQVLSITRTSTTAFTINYAVGGVFTSFSVTSGGSNTLAFNLILVI